jgi:serine/threonine protein kinase
MAPEQLRGDALDRRADLFSLGVLLYELSTGTRLYSGLSPASATEAVMRGDVPDPRTRRSGYPDELARIVLRALAFDRDARYATADELIDDLDALMRARGWSRSLASLGAYIASLASPMKVSA